jgi:hypothetical protein
VDFGAQLMNPDGSTESRITIQAVDFYLCFSGDGVNAVRNDLEPADKFRIFPLLPVVRNYQFIDLPATGTIAVDTALCRNPFNRKFLIQLIKK